MQAEALKVYALKLDENGHITGEVSDDAGAELVALAKSYVHDHPGVSFSEALNRVRQDKPDLAKQYGTSRLQRQSPANSDNPSATIHAKASALVEVDPNLAYAEAVARVLKDDAKLAGEYATYVSNGRRQ